jgi:pimeloyl-ACP methyl ester carboxylesterase
MRRYERGYRPATPKGNGGGGKVRTGVSPAQVRRRGCALRLTYRLFATSATQRLASWASAAPPLRRMAYDVAALEYLRRYVCRRVPMPPAVFESMAGANLRQYETMWGPGEYFATGDLKDWDVTDRLAEVEVPTLITSGRYDEATPAQMRLLQERLPDACWVMFDDSAHMAIFEEPERYLAVVSGFLAEVEARTLA